ncbi:universal stress protein [Roseofilum sp. BLCC_M154]|uniref:Universal stress protein n=1 Tax=Roseofilum acuticapitatum BLCC-M154 TaxID=3022444 RepID=A0ABT7AZV9_9CYAN|nr:universal stress protein [Roseofilum acuticapitatum]MDJ1172434.1 universal stress protein [Roseofilum acuticapitatum BLCC-M154]
MVSRILVALDRSQTSHHIFQAALVLAQVYSARLMLLHVLSSQSSDSPPDPRMMSLGIEGQLSVDWVKSYHQQWEKYEQESLELLKTFEEQALQGGIETELTQTYGNPGHTICNLAQSWDADLVVMGRRDRSNLTEWFLGSVSNYVIHHAACSVYLVHS